MTIIEHQEIEDRGELCRVESQLNGKEEKQQEEKNVEIYDGIMKFKPSTS